MYGGIEFDVTPNVESTGDLRLWVTVRLKIVSDNSAKPMFASQPVHHEVKLSPGQSALLGGFVAPAEVSALAEIKNVDKIPIFSSFTHAEGQERSGRELVILLKSEMPRPPTVKKEPPNPTPANPIPPNATPPNATPPNVLKVSPDLLRQPAPAPAESSRQTPPIAQRVETPAGDFSVQIGAFANPKSAEDIKTALQQQYPDTFIDTLAGDRVLYRVRVGHFANAANARQVLQRLRAAGFDAMIVRRD